MKRQFIAFVIACIILLTLCSCTANKGILSSSGETVSRSRSIETLLQNNFLVTVDITNKNGELKPDFLKEAKPISFDEIQQFKGLFQQYNPKYYYNFLSGNEQLLYNMFIYMSENGCENIVFSQDLVDTQSIEKVLHCAQLDYPSLETNYNLLIKTINPSNPKGDETYSGYYVHLTAYRKDKKEKNLQALKKAEEIVKTMPQQLGDKEKAGYLFRYLVEHVTYSHGVDKTKTVYLYSALCEEASDCDGFANAYSLLCNMAGLECIKVTYHPAELKAYLDTHTELRAFYPEADRESGHIWNMVKINNKYYHYDSSGSVRALERENVPSEILMGASDRIALRGVEYPPDISVYVPSSDRCLYPEETLALTDEHYEVELAAISTQLKQNIIDGKNYVYFLMKGTLLKTIDEISTDVVVGSHDNHDYGRRTLLPNRQGELLILLYRQ